jgi:hypothetical protein
VGAQTQIVTFTDFLFGGDMLSIRINTDNSLELWNENTTAQMGSDSRALVTGEVYRVELSYVNSTRAATAYLNGEQFATGTVDADGDNLDQVHLGIGAGPLAGIATTGEFNYDNYCHNDQTVPSQGTFETGLVGDEELILLMVNAAGDNSTGSRGGTDTGADFSQLNEKPPDDITTYYLFDANNEVIDLNIDSASAWWRDRTRIKMGYLVVRHAIASGSNPFGYNGRIKSEASGTLQNGVTRTHNDATWKTNGDTVPRITSLVSYIDPQNGAPWTVARLETAQIGVLCTDANGPMRMTTLGIYIGFSTAALDVISPTSVLPIDHKVIF